MFHTNHHEIPKLFSQSFTSTEAALTNYIHAVFLLALALKKRWIKSQDEINQHESDLFLLLDTLTEIEKIFLKHLSLYHRYLETDELIELKKEIIHHSNDHEFEKKVRYYTSSIMKLCYRKNDRNQMDYHAKRLFNDLTNFFELKRNLIKQ